MRRLVLIIVFGILLVTGISYAKDIQWKTLKTSHFIVYYAEGTKPTAERAAEMASKWYPELAVKLKYRPGGFIPIYLYPDRGSFSEDTGVGRGESIVGMAQTRTRVIRLDATGAMADISEILPHELVHVFISYKLGENHNLLPLWMHEGLASYLTDNWDDKKAQLLTDAATSSGLMGFNRISTAFPDSERSRAIAYVQSYSAVEYMAEKYGQGCIPDILDSVSEGRSFPTALFYSIGMKPEDFEKEWREYIWETYRSNRLSKFITDLFWFLAAMLVLIAFFVRMLQRRRKIKKFEEEDAQE